MNWFGQFISRWFRGPMIRPLGLAGPVFVLLIALPLLRPLRHPSEADVSIDETLRLATVRALVEHRSLALEPHRFAGTAGTIAATAGCFSAQPPMMALLLAPAAWGLVRLGYSFDANASMVSYLLTLIGSTLPVAAAAGLIYRMGRLFELPRTWRAGLGIVTVAASGLLSYSTVLNAQAPAAVLVLCDAACLIHVAAMQRADRRAGWFALAGATGAAAAAIEPSAALMLILLGCAIPAMSFSTGRRLVGILVYTIGCVPVLAVHAAWNLPVTGDVLPASVHLLAATAPPLAQVGIDPEDDPPESFAQRLETVAKNGFATLVGNHGPFSHFPILAFGIAGIAAVMHRHWPMSTKTLAAATAAAAVVILCTLWLGKGANPRGTFASAQCLIFSPLLLFWAGAWLRRAHGGATWTLAATLVIFSMLVGVAGAADPMPRRGYDRYSAFAAVWRVGRVDR